MKYLGLIADTHQDWCNLERMKPIKECFSDVELILHAGDITHVSILDCLSTIAPVHAVRGNMDMSPALSNLPSKKIIEWHGYRIGLIHGWGAPDGIQKRIQKAFSENNVSIIVYGHSHRADVCKQGHCLMVNPGSAFDRRYAPFCSIGRLKLDREKLSADIVRLQN
jgi:uncharacterized protein